jgi:Lipopolysaccharide-assembly
MKKLAFLAACLLTVSCGYIPVGTGGSLPPEIKRIQVPLFENRTTRFQLDLKLTQAVIDEIVARGKIEITTDAAKADAILIGRILTFTATPIAFSNKTADRYDIQVVTEITLKETKTDRVIFTNPSYAFKTDYQVPQGTDFESSQSKALDSLAQLYARSLIVAILEGF